MTSTAAVEISVRGSHTVTLPPEQGTVHAALSAEGPSAEPVFAAVAATLGVVKDTLESRHHRKRGPITRYAIDQIRMSAHRPFTQDGTQLPLVHTAAVSITATFTDFVALADWAGLSAGVDGVSIAYIDWALTECNRLKVGRTTRQQAVRDAQRRAQDYADALDLGPVVVRSISDPGVAGPVQRKIVMASAMAAPAGEPVGFALRPEDVEISAEVEATFTVHHRKR